MTINIWSKIKNHLSLFYFQFVPAIAGAANMSLMDIKHLNWAQLCHNFQQVLPIPYWFERPIDFQLTKKSNQRSIITNTLCSCPEAGNGDSMSDFDLIIDTIMIPEPIDQPMPVEPVGNAGDDD